MKFNQDGTEVQLEGDIENNKVSIDTANIDFIVTILSTNLYSNPIQSFLRETVSNGWDSHVEAGVDEPVILELGTTSEGQDYCKIQDFGVGLSPERFNNVYRNIGSSTKRSDNSQIGGFGIGRFSALAYSEMVNITSIYDGIEYSYLMYKDGNSISIDLLHQKETNNRNGVSVQVNVKNSDMGAFVRGIKEQLPFFENLYVDTSNLQCPPNQHSMSIQYEGYIAAMKQFNESVIKKYNSFNVTSAGNNGRGITLLLGKVVYPLNIGTIRENYLDTLGNIPISLRFDIGELQVTPNREQVLYTDKSIELIKEKLKLAKEEIQVLIDAKTKQDYTSLDKYVESLGNTVTIELINQDQHLVTFNITNNNSNSTLNGVSYNKKTFLDNYNAIMGFQFFPTSFVVNNGKLVNMEAAQYNYKISLNNIKGDFTGYKFGQKSDFNNATKAWIRDSFKNNTRFLYPISSSKRYLRSFFKEIRAKSKGNTYRANKFTFDSKIFKVIARYCINNLVKIPVITDSSVPQSYLDKLKADMKAKRLLNAKAGIDWKENMNLYTVRESDVTFYKMTTDKELISLEGLKDKYKCLVVYDEKNSETLRSLANMLLYHKDNKIQFVEVAPTKMKLLSHLQNFVKLEDFMSDPKYKAIRNIATAKIIEETFPDLGKLKLLGNLDKISVKLNDTVERLYRFKEDYLGRFQKGSKEDVDIVKDIVELCKEKNYYNFEILGLINDSKKMIENAMFLADFKDPRSGVYNIPDSQIPYLLDYVIARKLFMPNMQVLNEIRNPK